MSPEAEEAMVQALPTAADRRQALRDAFASSALGAMRKDATIIGDQLADAEIAEGKGDTVNAEKDRRHATNRARFCAEAAYLIADAMLAARKAGDR